MSRLITIKDKQFRPYIAKTKMERAVKKIAASINKDLEKECPVFLVVLNGSFMFASDLLKEISIPCEVSFVKVASYIGTSSKGTVTELIGLSENLKGRTVVVVEDIVDSGLTMQRLTALLKEKNVKKIKIATALFKPKACKVKLNLDYIGINIPNDFVVGYGLDYEGFGRNLKQLYVLAK